MDGLHRIWSFDTLDRYQPASDVGSVATAVQRARAEPCTRAERRRVPFAGLARVGGSGDRSLEGARLTLNGSLNG